MRLWSYSSEQTDSFVRFIWKTQCNSRPYYSVRNLCTTVQSKDVSVANALLLYIWSIQTDEKSKRWPQAFPQHSIYYAILVASFNENGSTKRRQYQFSRRSKRPLSIEDLFPKEYLLSRLKYLLFVAAIICRSGLVCLMYSTA